MSEYFRPWKLSSLATGIGLLVIGSFYYQAPDWDVPISFIMAVCTYLTAPWGARVIVERRWRDFPVMLLLMWLSVDGCYALYWYWQDPAALAAMRAANFPASLSLYWICGLLWYPRCSLRELAASARASFDN